MPRKHSMAITIEMDQIRANALRNFQQPITGAVDIVPWLIHPFQPVCAFEQLHVFASKDIFMLFACEMPAHAGQCNFNSVRLKGARQIERIRPYAADRIDRH